MRIDASSGSGGMKQISEARWGEGKGRDPQKKRTYVHYSIKKKNGTTVS